MMHKRTLLITGLLIFTLTAIYLTCVTPVPPAGPEAAKVMLILKSSAGENGTSISDETGNSVSIGLILNHTQYIDSTIITVESDNTVEKRFSCNVKNRDFDTVYYNISFLTAGDRKVTATAYISSNLGSYPNFTTTAIIHITGNTLTFLNQKPELHVPQTKVLVAGETLSLFIKASDPDSGQRVTITAAKKPAGAQFLNDTLTWVTTLADVGVDTLIFVAKDNYTPALTDTDSVIVKVSATAVNRAPEWNSSVIKLSGKPGEILSLDLNSACTDPDHDTLRFALVEGLPARDSIINSTWSFIAGPTDTGKFMVSILAADRFNETATALIELTISNNGSGNDKTGPVIRRVTPSSDNMTVSSSIYRITISCIDESGVARVQCSMGADTFAVTNSSDSLYSATISNLQIAQVNTIRFIAIDKAPASNRCTLYVALRYDPNQPDNNAPIITLNSPPKDTIVTSDSCTVKVSCIDESGVASVIIDSVQAKKETGDIFSATIKNLRSGVYTPVTIVATDSATPPNTDSITIRIKYDNDNTGPSFVRITPEKDSVSTNSTSYTITLQCSDSSGVASLHAKTETSEFKGVRGTSNKWDVTITGLMQNAYTKVIITATDSSLKANTTKDTLFIINDPTMDDVDGPIINQLTSPLSGSTISDSQITIIDTIYDQSGIKSVTWSLNGGTAQQMTPVPGRPGLYSYTVSFTEAKAYTIQVIATDNSVKNNPSKQTIELNYVFPPKITTQPQNATVCSGENATVKLTATGTPPLQYQWRNGKIDIIGANSESYILKGITASCTLTCIVSNAASVRDTSIPVIISVAPLLKVTLSPANAEVCSGGSATFTATASGGSGFKYQWYRGLPPNGTLVTGATDSTLTVKATDGSGTYYCIVNNGNGCSATSTTVQFLKNQDLSLKIQSSETAICPSGSATLTAVPSGGTTYTYKWYSGNTVVSTSAIYKASTAGTYRCEVTSSSGCIAESSFDLKSNTISTKPSIRVKNNGPTEICPVNVPVELELYGGSLGTNAVWQWFNNGNLTTNDGKTSILAYPSQTTVYSVKGVGTCGESEEAKITITVKKAATAATISGAPSTAICSNTKVTLTRTGGTTGDGGHWEWRQGDNKEVTIGIVNQTSIDVYPASKTTYWVGAVGGCSEAWSKVLVDIKNGPTAATSILVSPATLVCPGTPVTLTRTGGSAGTNGVWRWYKQGNTTPLQTGDILSITPTASATYYVQAESDCGNSTPKSVQISVKPVLEFTETINDVTGDAAPTAIWLRVDGVYSENLFSVVWYKDVGGIITKELSETSVSYSALSFSKSKINNGNYYCIITDENTNCTYRSKTAKININ